MKILTLFLLLLVATARADLVGFTITAPTASDTFAIGTATAATAPAASAVWPIADTVADLLTCSVTAAPGAGKSWLVTVQTALAGTPNSFTDAGITCTIANTDTHCKAVTPSVAWVQDGSLTFKIHPAGTPTSAVTMQCALRVLGNRAAHMEAITAPVTGSVTAYGSIGFSGTNDFLSYIPLLNATTTRLSCVATAAPGSGNSWNIRIRRLSIPPWNNTPINCTIIGIIPTCQDTINTQTWINRDITSFRITAAGATVTAGAKVRCAFNAGP